MKQTASSAACRILTVLAAALAAACAQKPAQQAPAAPAPAAPASSAPAPPPSWAQGRPAELASSNLAPHAPGLIAKQAKDLPVDKIKLPPGFAIEVWATGLTNARSMTVSPKGTVFVGTRLVGNVYAVVDRGDRREVKVIAKGLHRPNGVAVKDGVLYVAELSRVVRFDGIEDRLDNPPAPVVVYDNLPKDEPHGWKFMALGPDGMLYVPIGAPCNICEPPATHALIRRISTDGKQTEVVARGVRNTVGFDWHPTTKELWFTDNGRDWMGENQPEDELNRVAKAGQHFGYPHCHAGDILDPEFGKGRSCSDSVVPEAKLGPHTAALGSVSIPATCSRRNIRNRIIIARKGSWNRTQKSGFDIVSVTPGQSKTETFANGWLQGDTFWGRPTDVQVMRDGSLLVSDDFTGAIYRISYKR